MRIGSLFSGYGGLDIAVQSVLGGELAWYSEIEPAACTVLATHHPGVPNLGDITAVDWAAVEPVDVLTGGYPCQPFSHAGKRKGTNDERHLWPYVRDAIRVLRPRITVLENVRGHLTLGFDTVLADIAELGMSARWGTVRAADAGAPHGRARLFIVVADAASERRDQGQHQPGHKRSSDRAGATAIHDGHRADGTAADPDRDGHGRELHARGVGSLEGEAAGRAPERQRARGVTDTGGHLAAADAPSAERRGAQRQHLGEAAGSAAEPGERARAAADADSRECDGREPDEGRQQVGRVAAAGSGPVNWGKYAPAIARWESVLGRRSPAPTIPGVNGRPRLSPVFVEFMMGLPEGHVTGHGLRPAQELKMLGNGVVPQQAALALRMLLGLPAAGAPNGGDLLPTPTTAYSHTSPEAWRARRPAGNGAVRQQIGDLRVAMEELIGGES